MELFKWVQLVFFAACLVVGLLARGTGWRLIGPLGLLGTASASIFLFGSPLPESALIAVAIALVVGCVAWEIQEIRRLRSLRSPQRSV